MQFALTVSALGTPESDVAVLQVLDDVDTVANVATGSPASAGASTRDSDDPSDGEPHDGDGAGAGAGAGDGAGGRFIKRAEPTLSAAARVRDAILTGVRGRELDVIARLLAESRGATQRPGGRAEMLAALARCVINERNPRRVARLLEIVGEQPADDTWRRVALLDGFGPPPGVKRPAKPGRPITLDAQPAVIRQQLALASDADPALQAGLKAARERIHWPGEPGYVPPPPPPPLTADERASFERGRLVYAATCAACHKPEGLGQPGLAPPLVDSEWVVGPPSRLARIILHGVTGPITVEGQTWNLDMPGLAKLSDTEISDVMTYVRRSWDHGASPVSAGDVKAVRATTRPTPWTERELLKAR